MPRGGEQTLTCRSAMTYRYLWSMEKAMSRSTGLPSLNTVTTSYWIPPCGGPSARICKEHTLVRGGLTAATFRVYFGGWWGEGGKEEDKVGKGINSKISAPKWRGSKEPAGSAWEQELEQRFLLHWSQWDFPNPAEIMRKFCGCKVSTETASEL